MARLGTGLLILGLLAIGYGVGWQLGLTPGSRVTLPPPVALARFTPVVREVLLPTPIATVVPTGGVAPTPGPRVATPTPEPSPVVAMPLPRLVAADAADRAQSVPPETGYAVRLTIPSIQVDTRVSQGGIVDDAHGVPTWQTLPFVAVHYGDLTALIGAPGNAVIAGHVVTLSEGNVFRLLYKIEIDDEINVWDHHDVQHTFRVVDVKLVPPDDISVMARTPDQTLTLITCGGTFNPTKREFSDRLIVTAKPLL